MAGSRHSKAKNPYEIMIYLRDLKCEALDMQHKANARGDKEEEARCFGYGAGLERGEILLSEWLREQGEIWRKP